MDKQLVEYVLSQMVAFYDAEIGVEDDTLMRWIEKLQEALKDDE